MGKKKTAFDVPEIGVRLSENPEHWSSSRYYRGRIARFFLFFLYGVRLMCSETVKQKEGD